MNISAPFIERPVMTVLLMVALAAFGAFGYSALPVSELPAVDFPTISVSGVQGNQLAGLQGIRHSRQQPDGSEPQLRGRPFRIQ